MIAETPVPPYYAVIFTSQRTLADAGYGAMAGKMVALAREQPGFLGIESYRNASGEGVTISYWAGLEDIRRWKRHSEHQEAQHRGKERWYAAYKVRVCKVEYDYGFENIETFNSGSEAEGSAS